MEIKYIYTHVQNQEREIPKYQRQKGKAKLDQRPWAEAENDLRGYQILAYTSSNNERGGLVTPGDLQDPFQGPQSQNYFHNNTEILFEFITLKYTAEVSWSYLTYDITTDWMEIDSSCLLLSQTW